MQREYFGPQNGFRETWSRGAKTLGRNGQALMEKASNRAKRGIPIKPDHDDAMGDLNLLVRRSQGGNVVTEKSEREEWIQMADDLIDKVKL